MSEPNTQIVKKQAKKCFFEYTKDNFPMYTIWLKDFFYIHHKIYEFIGDNLEIFYKFFDWLNHQKNSSKFMFEIKKEFMDIADEVLIYEIMIERFKNSENQFVIPVLEKNFENESDVEIDSYPDPEPCYNLMEERQVLQEHVSDNENSNYDNEFYLSFFVKN